MDGLCQFIELRPLRPLFISDLERRWRSKTGISMVDTLLRIGLREKPAPGPLWPLSSLSHLRLVFAVDALVVRLGEVDWQRLRLKNVAAIRGIQDQHENDRFKGGR
jgi:hypothetical protein